MSALLFTAYAFDLAIGDPRGLPHPVRWIGAAIARGEGIARARFAPTPSGERLAGAILTFAVVAGSAVATAATLSAARRVHPRLGRLLEIVTAASTLATRDLLGEAAAVHRALLAGDLPAARQRVGRIVGRDTAGLDESGVARATIEALAESTCDGIVAPLFFLALGGVSAAMAFKAVSTLDSMIGHHEEPYSFFGTAAARTDDAANFVPARMAAAIIALFAPLVGGSTVRSVSTILADARWHSSPNAGYPESAMAGALGVRLGGALSYGGVPAQMPLLGASGRAPVAADVAAAIRLSGLASFAAAACAALVAHRA